MSTRAKKPTRVININDKTDAPDEVYIGRGSVWGNQFSHRPSVFTTTIRVASREESIAKYEEWLMSRPDILATLPQLQGKTLVCFCKPKACHGDILARLADALDS